MLLQICVFAFADFNAPALTKPEWDSYYASLKDDNTLPMLCVGANESEVSLCWHADKDTAVAQVRLADNAESQQNDGKDQLDCELLGIQSLALLLVKQSNDNGSNEEGDCNDADGGQQADVINSVLDVAGQVEGEKFQMEMQDPLAPTKINSIDKDTDALYVLMPMRM